VAEVLESCLLWAGLNSLAQPSYFDGKSRLFGVALAHKRLEMPKHLQARDALIAPRVVTLATAGAEAKAR